jgi:hypothetical protein
MQPIDREHATSLFAQAIAHSILEKSVRAILSHLEQPSEPDGSQASPIPQQAHRWFSNLSDAEKQLVRCAILETAWIAFHALCYWLDAGAEAISESNGRLRFVFLLEAYESEQTTSEELLEKALPLVARFDIWSAVSEDGAHWMLLDMTVDDDPGENELGTTPYDEYTLEVAGELFVEALQGALNQVSRQSKPERLRNS